MNRMMIEAIVNKQKFCFIGEPVDRFLVKLLEHWSKR